MSDKEIQCPECGGILRCSNLLIPIPHDYWKCPDCKKIYTEKEIRERCGI